MNKEKNNAGISVNYRECIAELLCTAFDAERHDENWRDRQLLQSGTVVSVYAYKFVFVVCNGMLCRKPCRLDGRIVEG